MSDFPATPRSPSEEKSEDSLDKAPPTTAPAAFDGPAESEDSTLGAMAAEQDEEAVRYAVEFLKTVLRLRGVRIDRAQFLTSELQKRGIAITDIARAVEDNPASAGVHMEVLDDIVSSSIALETRKSSALSFAAGLPGGLAMFGTVPADVTQYYVHAFRVMQKIAYVYGWQEFLHDVKSVDDETLAKLASFLGVMMGVGGASASVTSFATQVARPALQKNIVGKALTKTAWYGPLKQTLKLVGVKVTKDSFAKAATKVVPVAGGVISGGMTFVSLKTQSARLARHLREIPPPGVDAAEYVSRLVHEEPEAKGKTMRAKVGGSILAAADSLRRSDAESGTGPDASTAASAVKDAAALGRRALSGAAQRLRRPKKDVPASTTDAEIGDAGAEAPDAV